MEEVFNALMEILREVMLGMGVLLVFTAGVAMACGGLGVLLGGCGHSWPRVLVDLVLGGLLVAAGLGLVGLIVV